jgi:hypothetical protein
MSTPTVPPASPNNPTRQLLDELDALMERMLSLPVEELDGEEPLPPPHSPLLREPALPPVGRIELPPSLTQRIEAGPPVPEIALPDATAPAVPPAAAATTTSPPPVRTGTRWTPSPTLERGLETPLPEVRAVWWMQPVLWCNRVFDRATLRLGPAGRWLRGDTGRTVLGWIGVVLLALALTCLVLDVLGWP